VEFRLTERTASGACSLHLVPVDDAHDPLQQVRGHGDELAESTLVMRHARVVVVARLQSDAAVQRQHRRLGERRSATSSVVVDQQRHLDAVVGPQQRHAARERGRQAVDPRRRCAGRRPALLVARQQDEFARYRRRLRQLACTTRIRFQLDFVLHLTRKC